MHVSLSFFPQCKNWKIQFFIIFTSNYRNSPLLLLLLLSSLFFFLLLLIIITIIITFKYEKAAMEPSVKSGFLLLYAVFNLAG